MMHLPVFEAESFKQATSGSQIRHGFFIRQGGVSQGIYQSLNIGLGSDDNPHHVMNNRHLIASYLGVEARHLISVHQCHSADVVQIHAPFPATPPKADALVSNRPNLALAIATADCAPVLFVEAGSGVIGAAHAGWRGAYSGVLENTVKAMEALGAKRDNIIAALGPCIGRTNYEVGEDFLARFLAQSPDNRRYFTDSLQEKHYLFDLATYNIDRLARMGVACEHIDQCTYAQEAHFYSYRRMVHRNEADYGRQMSVITLVS